MATQGYLVLVVFSHSAAAMWRHSRVAVPLSGSGICELAIKLLRYRHSQTNSDSRHHCTAFGLWPLPFLPQHNITTQCFLNTIYHWSLIPQPTKRSIPDFPASLFLDFIIYISKTHGSDSDALEYNTRSTSNESRTKNQVSEFLRLILL